MFAIVIRQLATKFDGDPNQVFYELKYITAPFIGIQKRVVMQTEFLVLASKMFLQYGDIVCVTEMNTRACLETSFQQQNALLPGCVRRQQYNSFSINYWRFGLFQFNYTYVRIHKSVMRAGQSLSKLCPALSDHTHAVTATKQEKIPQICKMKAELFSLMFIVRAVLSRCPSCPPFLKLFAAVLLTPQIILQ